MKYSRIQQFQALTLISAVAIILLFGAMTIRQTRSEWKSYQKTYFETSRVLEADRSSSAQLEIHQIVLPHFSRIDRCITCHLAVTDLRMTHQPLPYRVHSEPYLQDHPIDEFGCTMCHGGQGRAVDKKNAHARTASAHWSQGLLPDRFLQSSCGQCHLAIFSADMQLVGTETFQRGHDVFMQEGCLGCHKARGVGGLLGPDLTLQGAKTRNEYNFARISGEHTVPNWLLEHFKDPEMVSPGSQMLALELDEDQLHALVTFTMGLNKPNIPAEYLSLETLSEFKGERTQLPGPQLFLSLCSACHGKNGMGKDYKSYNTGVPAIFNQDVLSVASREFIEFTLYFGRGERQMPAWVPNFSGLKTSELVIAAQHIKSQRRLYSEMRVALETGGTVEAGGRLFEQHCSMCHGQDGRGSEMITLNNQSFLNAADDIFLYKTIVNGRRNTAMPGWGRFNNQEIAHMLAFLRSWQQKQSPLLPFYLENHKVQTGEQLYHYLCSRCHGVYGEGSTGPAIINRDFLDVASDAFLAQMIQGGRHNTAMFGWVTDVSKKEKLSTDQIGDIIAYLRYSAAQPKELLFPGPNFGDAKQGETLFPKHCAECHGETGNGKIAPALANQELLNSATNGYLYATVSLGREGTAMPSWGAGSETYWKLSRQERHDLVAFIRAWQNIVIKKPQ